MPKSRNVLVEYPMRRIPSTNAEGLLVASWYGDRRCCRCVVECLLERRIRITRSFNRPDPDQPLRQCAVGRATAGRGNVRLGADAARSLPARDLDLVREPLLQQGRRFVVRAVPEQHGQREVRPRDELPQRLAPLAAELPRCDVRPHRRCRPRLQPVRVLVDVTQHLPAARARRHELEGVRRVDAAQLRDL